MRLGVSWNNGVTEREAVRGTLHNSRTALQRKGTILAVVLVEVCMILSCLNKVIVAIEWQ